MLVVTSLVICMLTGATKTYASEKVSDSRAIAIVFDNSGSMYIRGEQAWCRATYAMEVFASMLNDSDILLIYPMHQITVGDKNYTMENPLRITDAAQASMIRDIYTEDAGGTPIESIDCAARGLQSITADKKYMVVLTDGGTFSKNGSGFTKERTVTELNKRIREYASSTMSVMYLGIGTSACIPSEEQSEWFLKRHAENSEDVLSTLTEMCNLIFGRDTLPKKHISGNAMDFDISMKKLIIFVQGEDISDLKITGSSGNPVGRVIGTQQTKYSTLGTDDYESVPDTSLQGMMVTYADCNAGSYNIDYNGMATSVEVYYEPDADLDFVFTDAAGNMVNPEALYEGDYKVSFGMKDAKTGKLIASDLLGNPQYRGNYYVNGEAFPIVHDGYSGEVPVKLKMDDTFDANLTGTYLSGYTITKGASDFGWPEGGLRTAPRPAGELKLEISGGEVGCSLQELENCTPFTAKIFYEGTQLTGKALETVELKWKPETSNAEIKQQVAEDHYKLTLHYKDPSAPQDTVCGDCTVTIYAYYSAEGSSEAKAECPLTYNIIDDYSPLQIELQVPEDYIVIKDLGSSPAMVAVLKLNGEPLSRRDYQAVELQVDCGGIAYTVTPQEQDSAYRIQLQNTEGLTEGEYSVSVSAVHTDRISRTSKADVSASITLSNMPLWLKWTIGATLLLVLIAIILMILHIKVLPKYIHVTKRDSTMYFDGEDVTKNTTFTTKTEKGQIVLQSKYAGTKTGLVMDIKPGRESYLRKPQVRRSAEVKSASLRKFGPATIMEASVGSIKYVLNEENGKLERMPKNDKPFVLKHGTTVSYTGTMLTAGVQKAFTVTEKLNFKKK